MQKVNYIFSKLFLNAAGLTRITLIMFLYATILACGLAIYDAGGTATAYVHCFYFPIIVVGMLLGVSWGTAAGLLSAFLLGPYMPVHLEPYTLQPLEGWLFRGLFFTGVGFISGMSATILRGYHKRQETQLLTDPITNLFNLRGLKHFLCRKQIYSSALMVIVVEINRLSEIEQAFGSDTLHELCRKIAIRLGSLQSNMVCMAHSSTGSFVIIAHDETEGDYLINECQRLLNKSFVIQGIPLFLEIYFGLAQPISPDDAVGSVIRRAKIAAMKALKTKKIQSTYEPKDDQRLKRRLHILHDLKGAMQNNKLMLYYQPKMDLRTGRITGVEALVRWPHKQLGMIPPNEFIPLIEKTLLINPFTEWLLKTAIQQLAEWCHANLDVTMALNFSMVNFQNPYLFELLFELLDQYDIPPHLIEIEVTETAVADNLSLIAKMLNDLRSKHIRIAIDDFGIGQSSLQYLCQLPVDTLKIDKFFIQSLLQNSASEAITRSAITLANDLKLETVAEGIETQEVFNKVKEIGCQIGQGYYISKPLSSKDIFAWLNAKKAGI